MPTGSTWYLPTLSCKLRCRSRAERWLDGSSSSGMVNGSCVPLLRLLPVRRGTVTLSSTLLDGELMDCNGLDMASSGRRTRLAGVSALGGFRIYSSVWFSISLSRSCGLGLTLDTPEFPCRVSMALSTLWMMAGCSTLVICLGGME